MLEVVIQGKNQQGTNTATTIMATTKGVVIL